TWTIESLIRYGTIDRFTLGNQAETNIRYDSYGYIDSILTIRNGGFLQRWNNDFIQQLEILPQERD
ncbi:MAG TPA: hypothetical protein VHO46_12710, partial [Bacteroidales bacterium]|nr:hypothetical protein [Bacteroidales bacterium]